MFPKDIGLEMEEQGPTLRILSVVIDVDENSFIRFFPNTFSHNFRRWQPVNIPNRAYSYETRNTCGSLQCGLSSEYTIKRVELVRDHI